LLQSQDVNFKLFQSAYRFSSPTLLSVNARYGNLTDFYNGSKVYIFWRKNVLNAKVFLKIC